MPNDEPTPPRAASVTRDSVRNRTRDWAADPASVAEIPHAGFNGDPVSGGFAFSCDRGLLVETVDGARGMFFHDPAELGDRGRLNAEIEKTWREAQHRNRPLGLDDISPWHRAAIRALSMGLTSVAELPAERREGAPDAARADHLLVLIRRFARAGTAESALRALAANDGLLEIPGEHDRAHACPVCGRPAIGGPRQSLSVCDTCDEKTVCSHDQLVYGLNIAFSGGFEARHAEDDSACAQVTADGRVWVDGHACRMREARFGGIYVAVDTGPPQQPGDQ